MLTKTSFLRFRLKPTIDLTKIFKPGESNSMRLKIPKKLTYNPTKIPGDNVLSASNLVRYSEICSSVWLESKLDSHHGSVGYYVDLDYKNPLYLDDNMTINSTVSEVKPGKIKYNIKITKSDTNELIGTCEHIRAIIRF